MTIDTVVTSAVIDVLIAHDNQLLCLMLWKTSHLGYGCESNNVTRLQYFLATTADHLVTSSGLFSGLTN